jgi:hypothetical protein
VYTFYFGCIFAVLKLAEIKTIYLSFDTAQLQEKAIQVIEGAS